MLFEWRENANEDAVAAGGGWTVGACEAAVRELLQTDARVAPRWAALTQQQQRCVRSLNASRCVCVCAGPPSPLLMS
jgi:hypothetical protein